MNQKSQWLLIKTEEEYEAVVARYEIRKAATAGTDHQEKLLLAPDCSL